MKRTAAILLVLVVLAACSAESDGTGSAAPREQADQDAAPGRRGKKGDASARPGDAGAPKRQKSKKQDGAAPGDESDDGDEGSSVFDDGAEEDDSPSALHPAAGSYVYSQAGFERFCATSGCEEEPLPSRQPVEISLRNAAGQGAVVVTEIEASDSRLLRTTTTFDRNSALVTDVYARFSYEGFTFEDTYRPDPPVRTLRFPLEAGEGWSGRWRDSTSGDYEVDVIERDSIQVNGVAVGAYKLSTVTNFRGEFTGSAKAIVWVDPSTKATVKTTGKLDLRSAFGRYVTEFTTTLRSGPGYR